MTHRRQGGCGYQQLLVDKAEMPPVRDPAHIAYGAPVVLTLLLIVFRQERQSGRQMTVPSIWGPTVGAGSRTVAWQLE